MLTRESMGGVYAVPPTPFTDGGEFDEECFRENVRRLDEIGVHGVVAPGSVGEFHKISQEDHRRLVSALVEETRGCRTLALAGCSSVNTDEALEKVGYAESCGADAAINVSPYYVGLQPVELVRYWGDLAGACPNIGLVVDNNPGTAQLHPVEIFRELAEMPTLCGSKEAHADFSLWYSLHQETGLTHMTATEQTLVVPTMRLGAKGVFSMSAAMCPGFMLEMHAACARGDWEQATRMQFRLRDVWRQLDGFDALRGYHSIARFKATVNAFGFLKCGVTRRPFIPVPDPVQELLTEFVRREFGDLIETGSSLSAR